MLYLKHKNTTSENRWNSTNFQALQLHPEAKSVSQEIQKKLLSNINTSVTALRDEGFITHMDTGESATLGLEVWNPSCTAHL